MFKDKFEKIIQFLEELPDRKFQIEKFGDTDTLNIGYHCNSICCAIGWMPVIFVDFHPKWVSCFSYREIMHYLNISQEDYYKLFFSDGYPNGIHTTRQEVIDRLKEFINSKESVRETSLE